MARATGNCRADSTRAQGLANAPAVDIPICKCVDPSAVHLAAGQRTIKPVTVAVRVRFWRRRRRQLVANVARTAAVPLEPNRAV